MDERSSSLAKIFKLTSKACSTQKTDVKRKLATKWGKMPSLNLKLEKQAFVHSHIYKRLPKIYETDTWGKQMYHK